MGKKITDLIEETSIGDTDLLYFAKVSGASFVDRKIKKSNLVPVVGASALTLIQEQILGGDVASVIFSSIPQTYRHLKIIIQARTTQAVAASNLNSRFNNDSGANYDYQQCVTSGTSASAGGSAGAQTSIPNGNFPGTSSTRTTQVGMAEILILNYTNTTFEKTGSIINGDINTNPVSTNNFIVISTFNWRSTAAINRIDILAAANNIKAGSIFSLYGML